jgi:hypothetical protein
LYRQKWLYRQLCTHAARRARRTSYARALAAAMLHVAPPARALPRAAAASAALAAPRLGLHAARRRAPCCAHVRVARAARGAPLRRAASDGGAAEVDDDAWRKSHQEKASLALASLALVAALRETLLAV